jgi:nucleotide-binding universal stress UspA family protein
MIKQILVPLDGSPLAETALPYAKAIARRTGADLTLVRAAENTNPPGDMTYQRQHSTLENAETYVTAVADDLLAQGFEILRDP